MKSQLSEFSYGFALTNEQVSGISLTSAPIFPSLFEEGKTGGGYDVKLDSPGVPLFIQFKRSDYMYYPTSKEYKSAKTFGEALELPYYRFPITRPSLSAQHEMLLALDAGTNLVYYAAPKFYTLDEINSVWKAKQIVQRSFFVAPSIIGHLDDKQHNIAHDKSGTWRCSVPKKITSINGQELRSNLLKTLNQERRPLKERLNTLLIDMQNAENSGRKEARESSLRSVKQHLEEHNTKERNTSRIPFNKSKIDQSQPRERPAIPIMNNAAEDTTSIETKTDAEYSAILRKAADDAALIFNAQLIIVQSIEEVG